MRATIRSLIVAAVPELGQRVLEPAAAGRNTVKPFAVVKLGPGDAGEEWANLGEQVEVWVYETESSFTSLDALARKVISALHRVRFDEGSGVSQQKCLAWYVGSEPDYADPDWKALTRRLRFEVFNLAFWQSSYTYTPDPVLALRTWCAERYPSLLGLDPATWTPSNATPGAYWRLTGETAFQPTAWGAWVEATLACHVIAGSRDTRLIWTRRITEDLVKWRHTAMSDGSRLWFQQVAANSEADPLRQGQISLTARFGVVSPAPGIENDELINHAFARGDVEGAVHASA